MLWRDRYLENGRNILLFINMLNQSSDCKATIDSPSQCQSGLRTAAFLDSVVLEPLIPRFSGRHLTTSHGIRNFVFRHIYATLWLIRDQPTFSHTQAGIRTQAVVRDSVQSVAVPQTTWPSEPAPHWACGSAPGRIRCYWIYLLAFIGLRQYSQIYIFF